MNFCVCLQLCRLTLNKRNYDCSTENAHRLREKPNFVCWRSFNCGRQCRKRGKAIKAFIRCDIDIMCHWTHDITFFVTIDLPRLQGQGLKVVPHPRPGLEPLISSNWKSLVLLICGCTFSTCPDGHVGIISSVRFGRAACHMFGTENVND